MTFGSHTLLNCLHLLRREAEATNVFDRVLVYMPENLTHGYVSDVLNRIGSTSRGFGYWSWKPEVIYQTLQFMLDDDVLVYADGGCEIVPSRKAQLLTMIQRTKQSPYGILSFVMKYVEQQWTKADLAAALNATYDMLSSGQHHATVIYLKKCSHTVNLIDLWRSYAKNTTLIDDSPSRLPNHASFAEHRHDQSIFSLLRKKFGSTVVEDDTVGPNPGPIQAARRFKMKRC